MKTYTVVGFYDTQEVYVTSVEAETAQDAAMQMPDTIYVVSVFAGEHDDLLESSHIQEPGDRAVARMG